MKKQVLALALLIGTSLLGSARGADSTDDELFAKAVRASLLSDSPAYRETFNQARGTAAEPPLRALALAIIRPVPNKAEAREVLKGSSGYLQKSLVRLIEKIEPREAWRQARRDREYQDLRRTFNAAAAPLLGLFQGQLFPLVSVPFDIADHLFIGRRFATPEERRELTKARAAAASPLAAATIEAAEQRADRLQEKRVRSATLQATENGRKATREGRVGAAEFWFGREMLLRKEPEPFRREHEDLLSAENRLRLRRNQSQSIADGDQLLGSEQEAQLLGSMLRRSLLGDAKETLAATRRFEVDLARSAFIDDAQALEAATHWTEGERELAVVQLDEIASGDQGRLWTRRAGTMLADPRFDRAVPFRSAKQAESTRLSSYIWMARPPWDWGRAWTNEESRLARSTIFYRARALFITDALARFLFLPFADPFPRPELLAAGKSADPQWLSGAQGGTYLRRFAAALTSLRRYTEAAEAWRAAGAPDRAFSAEYKAARALLRLARSSQSAREKRVLLERLVAAWPAYNRIAEATALLELAQYQDGALGTVTVEELRAKLPSTEPFLSAVPPAARNGKKADGEIDDPGLVLLPGDLAAYRDRQTKRWLLIPFPESESRQLLAALDPPRRRQKAQTELAKPLPRKRIPIALEAGFFPGFDFAPGLVPYEPDPQLRALYE
jgi:hypothetical protein